jgi:hypothetical protein
MIVMSLSYGCLRSVRYSPLILDGLLLYKMNRLVHSYNINNPPRYDIRGGWVLGGLLSKPW